MEESGEEIHWWLVQKCTRHHRIESNSQGEFYPVVDDRCNPVGKAEVRAVLVAIRRRFHKTVLPVTKHI